MVEYKYQLILFARACVEEPARAYYVPESTSSANKPETHQLPSHRFWSTSSQNMAPTQKAFRLQERQSNSYPKNGMRMLMIMKKMMMMSQTMPNPSWEIYVLIYIHERWCLPWPSAVPFSLLAWFASPWHGMGQNRCGIRIKKGSRNTHWLKKKIIRTWNDTSVDPKKTFTKM